MIITVRMHHYNEESLLCYYADLCLFDQSSLPDITGYQTSQQLQNGAKRRNMEIENMLDCNHPIVQSAIYFECNHKIRKNNF